MRKVCVVACLACVVGGQRAADEVLADIALNYRIRRLRFL